MALNPISMLIPSPSICLSVARAAEIDLTKLDEDVKRAALGEAQLLSSLQHPCIVGYVDVRASSNAAGGCTCTCMDSCWLCGDVLLPPRSLELHH